MPVFTLAYELIVYGLKLLVYNASILEETGLVWLLKGLTMSDCKGIFCY